MKRLLSLLFMLLWAAMPVFAQQPGDIVILYDNDVHCAVDGYPIVAGLRDSLEHCGCHVVAVSAGDFSFGGPVGAASKGEFVVRLMNAVGYDVACLGNHEFDYGLPQLMRIDSLLSASLLCCNFQPNDTKCSGVNSENSELRPVTSELRLTRSFVSSQITDHRSLFTISNRDPRPFLPFVVRNVGGCQLAFVGVTTPTTLYTSTPTSFQDETGQFAYNFSSNTLGSMVQRSVDCARAAGADVVVLLSHLGDIDGVPTSVDLLSQLHGVDVVLDGHDHHIVSQRMVADQSGTEVPLTSTGAHFQNIGMLVIKMNSEGVNSELTNDGYRPNSQFSILNSQLKEITISTRLLPVDSLRRAGVVSRAVSDTLAVINSLFEAMGTRIVATSQSDLVSQEGSIRVCRLRETNLGDLVADAYRVCLKADIGWVNGGGLRANVPAGPISYTQLFAVSPYSNKTCVVRVSGQDILNALETAVREYPKAEGCFPQVSGLSFVFDTAIPTAVVLDSNGTFLRVDGPYRVSNVKVGGEPLRLDATYTVAGTEYILLNGGDALSFPTRQQIPTYEATDLELLERYLVEFLHGTIGSEYAVPQGRITIK